MIDGYLSATRSFYDFNQPQTLRFTALAKLLDQYFISFPNKPESEIKVVYSSGLSPETVTTSSGKNYIILEESFHKLSVMTNALSQDFKNYELFESTSSRIMAEIFLKHGRYFESAGLSIYSNIQLEGMEQEYFNSIFCDDKYYFTSDIQSIFIIAHEYSHSAMKHPETRHKYINLAKDYVFNNSALNRILQERSGQEFDNDPTDGHLEEVGCDILAIEAIINSGVYHKMGLSDDVFFWSIIQLFLNLSLYNSIERQIQEEYSEYAHVIKDNGKIFERDGMDGVTETLSQMDELYFLFESRRDAVHRYFSENCFSGVPLFDHPCGTQYFDQKQDFEIHITRKAHENMQNLDMIFSIVKDDAIRMFGDENTNNENFHKIDNIAFKIRSFQGPQ